MYSNTKNFLIHQTPEAPKTRRFQNLVDLIFRGMRVSPKQAFGTMYQIDAACVLGTAFQGGLSQNSEVLKEMVTLPCRCYKERHSRMQAALIHLNDKHKWKREYIADWLLTLE